MLLSVTRNTGGATIGLVSPFGGCVQYTPHIGYVADPASSSILRQITPAIEVDVSHRVTDYLVASNSRTRNQPPPLHGPAHYSLTV